MRYLLSYSSRKPYLDAKLKGLSMRKFLIVLTVGALIWCGWWILGAFAIDRVLAQWRAARIAEGWAVSFEEPQVSGFPGAWDSQIASVSLVDPLQLTQLSFDLADVRLPTYWPFSAEIKLPDTPINLQTPFETYIGRSKDGLVQVALRPSLSPTLRSFAATSGQWQVNVPQGNLASAAALDLRLVQNEQNHSAYAISFNIDKAIPGDVFRKLISLPDDWPREMEVAVLSGGLVLAPNADSLDRPAALIRGIDQLNLHLAWGSFAIKSSGTVKIDPAGTPDGTVRVELLNWRAFYDVLKDSGAIRTEDQFAADIMLNSLSNIGGNPETLDLTITFSNGMMSVGPITLGPAPKILF